MLCYVRTCSYTNLTHLERHSCASIGSGQNSFCLRISPFSTVWLSVCSGYTGGHTDNPTYKAICTGNSGHAEVVKVEFDSSVISFETLLAMFFTLHDATQLNRQGNDIGTQYRSVVYYHDQQQQLQTQAVIAELLMAMKLSCS